MSVAPNGKQWIVMLILCLGALGCAITLNHDRRDLKGSTEGKFAEEYTVETETRHGIVTRKTYHLNYSFEVNGRSYQGQDTQDTEPAVLECTVYFDPHHPEINALIQDPVNPLLFGLAIVLGGLAVVAFFPLMFGFGRNTPPPPPPLPGRYGDAVGEYLMMPRGGYDATMYVPIAFFGQIVVMNLLGTTMLQTITGGHINRDLATFCACLVAVVYTIWIYWDRWLCIARYGSRYTSGCVNISIIYLPIVIVSYANYRGLLKLKGR